MLRDKVIAVVAAEFGVSRAQLLAPTRGSRKIAWARQVAMWLYLHCGGEVLNFSEAGRQFDRDRTTVRHAWEKVMEDCPTDLLMKLKKRVQRAS